MASAPTKDTHRTDKQVQSQFHGRIFTCLDPAPDGDQEEHREDGNFIKEEQLEQIQGDEHAEHAAARNEQEGKELARAVVDTQEISTPVNMTTPVNSTSGVLIPSTPTW